MALSDARDRHIDMTMDYALMPVWLLDITYQGQKYTFAINGSTGKVAGKPLFLSIKALLTSMLFPFGYLLLLLFSGQEPYECIESMPWTIFIALFIFLMIKRGHHKKETTSFDSQNYIQNNNNLPDVDIQGREDIHLGREWEKSDRIDEVNHSYQNHRSNNIFAL